MADETMVIGCPGCGKRFRGPAAWAGRKVKCPNCGVAFAVPAAPATVASPAPTAAPIPAAAPVPRRPVPTAAQPPPALPAAAEATAAAVARPARKRSPAARYAVIGGVAAVLLIGAAVTFLVLRSRGVAWVGGAPTLAGTWHLKKTGNDPEDGGRMLTFDEAAKRVTIRNPNRVGAAAVVTGAYEAKDGRILVRDVKDAAGEPALDVFDANEQRPAKIVSLTATSLTLEVMVINASDIDPFPETWVYERAKQ